ncbi:hypothetical protein [Actinoplanes sp. GCM10030250]|uniref:hypothetical protein n=1 Tax=Actinoplanes sp. GCM10030250 TaxID=3273376 RepID=UPI0036104430
MRKRGAAAVLMAIFVATLGLPTPARAAEPTVDLSMNLGGPGEVLVGETAEYRLTAGLTEAPADLSSVRAVLTLPDGVTFESAKPDAGGPCTAAASTVTCVAVKKEDNFDAFVWYVTVRFAADLALGERLRFTAVASSDGTEATPIDNTSTFETGVVHLADLGLTAIPPTGKITLGQPVKYTLIVTNHGPGVVRHFALHEGFDSHWYSGGTVEGAEKGECFGDPGMMICDVSTELQPGEEVRLVHNLPTSTDDTVLDLTQSVSVSFYEYAGDKNKANDTLEIPLEFAAKASSSPSASPSPSATTTPEAETPTLPITGPATPLVGLTGLLLLLTGAGIVLATRRRRT